MIFARRPKTPLRVLCIAAFDYLARLQGETLEKRRRLAMAHACDFGSLCDDHYDHGWLDSREYRSLRRELRQLAPERATVQYLRELRRAERGRPSLSENRPGIPKAVTAYRTRVLELSLRWMEEISGLRLELGRFDLLLNLVGLMQIADDLLDWKSDQAAGTPTYVTAFLLDAGNNSVAIPLRREAGTMLRHLLRATRENAAAVPFAVAGALTWLFVAALLKARFPQ